MAGELFDPAISAIERGMAKTIHVQEVIAHNIANAKTPGYIPKKFDEALNKAVERQDRNSVNLEEEMADMAKNNTEYSSYIKLMSAKLGILRTVISQGRR